MLSEDNLLSVEVVDQMRVLATKKDPVPKTIEAILVVLEKTNDQRKYRQGNADNLNRSRHCEGLVSSDTLNSCGVRMVDAPSRTLESPTLRSTRSGTPTSK